MRSSIAILASLAFVLALVPGAGAGADERRSYTPALASGPTVAALGRATPLVTLEDGVELSATFVGPASAVEPFERGQASPRSATTGDFDGDGVADAAVGYVTPAGGAVALFVGAEEAIYSPAGAPPFRRTVSVVAIAVAPELLASGDFDNDGARDLVVASPGRAALTFLSGGGRGGFRPPVTVDLPGPVATLAAGDLDRRDGLADLAVALGGNAPQVLVFEGPDGALRAEPERVAVPETVSAIAIGDVDAGPEADLVLAAGRDVLVVAGSDRGAFGIQRPDAFRPRVQSSFALDAPVRAVAAVNLGGSKDAVGALLDTGDLVAIRPPEGRGVARLASGLGGAGALAPARVAASGAESLVAFGGTSFSGTGPRIHVAARAGEALSFDCRAVPVAVVPMRLNGDAISDLVVLLAGRSVPTVLRTTAPATFTVTSAADAGPGSLRQAIDDANGSPGADAIRFAIGGAGPHSIALASRLPEVTEAVSIDATTQPGYNGSPRVELNGAASGAGADGIYVTAGASTIRGFAINRVVDGGDFQSGNGIRLEGGGGNIVEACYLGIDPTGTIDLPIGFHDLAIHQSAGNTVGGTVGAARNVISGSHGVAGVAIFSDAMARDNTIAGNFIGTDATGTVDLNTSGNGVFLAGGPNNVVGGTTPGSRNIISGNGGNYVHSDVYLQQVTENRVQGNYIGPDVTGTNQIEMTHAGGVTLDGAAVGNLVGGTAAGAANLITLTLVSVQVGEFNGTSRGNAILGNSMFSNEVLGINLGYDNVTPNDRVDADSGPNDLQNFPVLTSAATNGSEVEVAGRLGSVAGRQFRIELFANDSCNLFGSGEGKRYLGSVDVTTDGTGVGEFTARFAAEEVAGGSITATATSSDGSTSEFSLCVELALSWQVPDPGSAATEPPPRNLSATLASRLGGPDPVLAPLGTVGFGVIDNPVTCYNVYRSNAPNVQPGPGNFFTSVPPGFTFAGAGVFAGGTFFVVTACYATGESGPSNEVQTGVPPTITSLKATAGKVTVKGSGFTTDVLVTVDGIPFQTASVVKSGNTKVVQRGVLLTGESLGNYAQPRGGVVSILVRNSTGGISGARVTVRR